MAAERWLLWWWLSVVVMVNEGWRRVAWWGGVHVRFLGFGHTLMVLVTVVVALDIIALTLPRYNSRSSSDSVD